MRTEERFNKKLLVEGADDQSIIWALCQKFNIKENFDIIDCNGVDKLIQDIPVRLKQSEIETLGIIIDADWDIDKRWNSLRTLLTNRGFILPKTLPKSGIVFDDSMEQRIKIGIWIMPNNNLSGLIEDFVQFLIPAEDSLYFKAQNVIAEIEEEKINKYPIQYHSKALIHTWLAWQMKPGQKMGQAITANYLNTKGENCNLFINWLNKLFNDE